ncbi:hypothetical protein [Planctomyces sp. SH-PL14]|uniref:hypothetical protein n=1 Tax=Planctomyces sp. SH-PL14 TaxID=1632864 RepID=UPI00078B5D78|nr:hypothetical protein [Planctomyces sp. SH-PL14]AMV20449.1 hypothetical protein VT03_21300 [Planctomyces sp. SH-PL14]
MIRPLSDRVVSLVGGELVWRCCICGSHNASSEFFCAARQLFCFQPKGDVMTGVELIAAERERQVSSEGWTPEHDDGHQYGELSNAAACYAMSDGNRSMMFGVESGHASVQGLVWPFESHWWKPTPGDRIRELVKAGALIAAEIDRLGRTGE